MTISKIPLRTLLTYFGLSPERRTAAVRADARAEIRKAGRPTSNGGDFHSCFWRDAKAHATGEVDLTDMTALRIDQVKSRKRLYPQLTAGFLAWWNENRRWINEDIVALPKPVKAPYSFHEIGGVVKVDNILALSIPGKGERLVYPYFSETPVLSPDVARMGLWLMGQALPDHRLEDMRILDVIRGTTFSVDKQPLIGIEGAQFVERYARMLDDWRQFIRQFS